MKKGGHTSASFAENHPNEAGRAHLFAQIRRLTGQTRMFVEVFQAGLTGLGFVCYY